jgi:hypothetical protein
MITNALVGLMPRLDNKSANSNQFWATVYMAVKIPALHNHLFTKLLEAYKNLKFASLAVIAIRLVSFLYYLAQMLNRVAIVQQFAEDLLVKCANDKMLKTRIAAIIPNSNAKLDALEQLQALKDICVDSDLLVSLLGLRGLEIWLSDPSNLRSLSETDCHTLFAALNSISERVPLDEVRGILLCSLFGTLGIIDASPFSETKQTLPCFTIRVEDEPNELCCILIEKHLFQSMRSATNSKWQDKIAFVIQEFCKFCSFASAFEVQDSWQKSRWLKFPEIVRRTIEPLLHARYNMTFAVVSPAESEIFYASLSYQEWLHRWTIDLISRIEDVKQRQVFLPCRALSRLDQGLLRTIIMAVISRLLRSDMRSKDYLAREISSLLNHGRALLESQNETDRSFVAFFRFLFFFDDYLRYWRFRLIRARNKPLSIELQLCLSTLEDLDGIFDPYDFACCSILCDDHQRALYYLEKYVSRNGSIKQDVRVYRIFQLCYAGLMDSDGMEGVLTQLRTRDVNSAILAHETNRDWESALTCYEVELRHDMHSTRFNYGLLRCLRNLGRLDPIIGYASNVRNENVCEIVKPFLIESAWRLKAWDVVDREFSLRQPSSFDDDIALLLKNLRNADAECFGRDIIEAKKRVWKVLSSKKHLAESIVQRAMVQSYMLQDISLFLNDRHQFLDQRIWAQRLTRSNCSILVLEPIINLRRVLLELR